MTHPEQPDSPPPAPDPGGPLQILLVDDHALVREGLASLINAQPDMQVIGEAGSVREAIAQAHALHPDLILMDFSLPDGKGDELARVIISTLPESKIVFLTVHDDDETLFAAISTGAVGYLLKNMRSSELISRLRGLAHGDVALAPAMAQRVLERFKRQGEPRSLPADAHEQLTKRETTILRLIVKGHTNRQIGDILKLSVRTVEYHRANLTGKLGLHTRADLVRYATEHGLIDSED